jgi:hypothetical protein
MSSPTQAQYEANELAIATRDENRINAEPLADRKEAQATFLEAMATEPKIVAERIEWLLEGNYGHGQMLMAQRATKRMNRAALWTQLVAVFEWRCPRNLASAAWQKLSGTQQARLQRLVEKVIAEYDAREE